MLIEKLQFAAFGVEKLLKSGFLHQRQNRNVVLNRNFEFDIERRVFCGQKIRRNRDYKKLHLLQVVFKFLIKDGKILPPFFAVSGLGETAAWDIVEGRKGKRFISIEEFAAACPKVSKTHVENLKAAGAFGDLPDTSQITLF